MSCKRSDFPMDPMRAMLESLEQGARERRRRRRPAPCQHLHQTIEMVTDGQETRRCLDCGAAWTEAA